MARPLCIEYEGAFYHVTAPGNERKRGFVTVHGFWVHLKPARHPCPTDGSRAGKLFVDLSYFAVAKAQQRFSAKLDKDRSPRKIINKITTKVSYVKI